MIYSWVLHVRNTTKYKFDFRDVVHINFIIIIPVNSTDTTGSEGDHAPTTILHIAWFSGNYVPNHVT